MVVISFIGTTLDGSTKDLKRWQKWRPTVSLCQHEDVLVNRLELLISDKDQALADMLIKDIKQISPETKVNLHTVNLNNPWNFEEVYGALHDFSTNYDFDLEHEEYFMHLTTGTHVAQICMFLLTEARYFPAKLLQSSPPKKQEDGAGRYSIIDLDLSKYDLIAQRFESEQEEATSFLKSGIHTKNKAFNEMIDQIEKVVIKTKSPVLLMGPTGAGKSQLARRIYDLKKLRHQMNGSFVEVNCATLKGDSAMSALFGHKKGAFTGAVSERSGLLSSANKGVLFLDEIGELGLDEQAMILRAIEEKKFLPVGSDKEVSSDFQLLAGTNKDLSQEVATGNFREDLLARLNLWTYHLPGLKDRREDIEPNIEYELKKYSQENAQNVTFNKEARDKYLKFCLSNKALWSANFRDLSASINRMATLAEAGRIRTGEVSDEIERLKMLWHSSSKENTTQILGSVLSQDQIDDIDLFDRVQLASVIEVCRNEDSMSAAGRKLFSNTRTKKKVANDADRLSKYLHRFGLNWSTVKN
ncbi:MAG: sigma 54-interacting transcriptional regulator [Hyphomicrobiaceae bacterium]|nr:sigma 54-interacting transcriptional regulator [Hyphomicrobiaceae bacterium]